MCKADQNLPDAKLGQPQSAASAVNSTDIWW